MPTVEDILRNSDHILINEPLFVIDSNLRVVSIPRDGVVAGVVGDKLVNFIDFKMPKTYNGFDMSTFSIRIDYVNANGEASYNTVTNYSVDGDYLYFSWLIDSHVTAYSGNVMFSARLFKQESGVLKQCFNTSVGNIKVLDGIIAEEQISYDEQRQIISDIIQEVTDYFINNPTDGSVVVTPSLTSGTKVAEITVNGSKKTLYAPTPSKPVTDDHINSLIDTKLGVIENGAY